MRSYRRFLLALALTVVLAACGDGGTTTPSTSAVPTPSAAQLHAKLLTVRDLGAKDWKLAAPINAADLASIGQSIPCPGHVLRPAVAKRLTAITGTQFEPTDHSYKHVIELVLTGDPAQLAGDLQTFFAAMDSCSKFASAATDGRKLTMSKLQLPPLGDQRGGYISAAVIGAGKTQRIWYTRSAAVRVGPVAVVLGLTEILATPQTKPQISDHSFVHLLRTAVGKLAL